MMMGKTTIWRSCCVPVRLAEHPTSPGLVEVAQNYPHVFLFQLGHGRRYLVGKTLGF